jgi:hypothetical protein
MAGLQGFVGQACPPEALCDQAIPTPTVKILTRKRYQELVSIAVEMANTLDSKVDKSEYCTLGRIMEQIVHLS